MTASDSRLPVGMAGALFRGLVLRSGRGDCSVVSCGGCACVRVRVSSDVLANVLSPGSTFESDFGAKAGLKISNTNAHFAHLIFFDGFRSKRSSSYWYRA